MDIGNRFTGPGLYCLTPNPGCCDSSVSGEWYLSDGTPVSSSTTLFSRSQVHGAVRLSRNSATITNGVFHCAIPDASGTSQNIFVGIYSQGDGKIIRPQCHVIGLSFCYRCHCICFHYPKNHQFYYS